MSKADRYFQFPLSLLAYGPDVPTRMNTIVNYCIVTAGARFAAKHEDYEIDGILPNFPTENLPGDFDENDEQHREILLGMHVLGVRRGRVPNVLECHRLADDFSQGIQRKHGSFPYVRIKTAYALEVHTGKGMTYREFSILCALYAIIGDKSTPVRICRDRIRAGALGYKSAGMLFSNPAILSERVDGAKPLTVDQIRHTLDRLEKSRHFARVQASPRQVYFSNRLTRAAMSEILLKNKRRPNILHTYRQQDRELQRRIRESNTARPHQRRPQQGPATSPL